MRLTCPNCGAQYEVPDDVIPDEGRDVQCSNCGDTWFQQTAGFGQATDDIDAEEQDNDPSVPPAGHEAAPTASRPEAAVPEDEDLPAEDAELAAEETEGTEGRERTEAEIASEPFQDPTPPEVAVTKALQEAASPQDAEDVARAPRPSRPQPRRGLAHDSSPASETAPVSDAVAPEATPQKRRLDPALGEILREEAEREASLRANEHGQAEALETQPNLGLDDFPENEEARRTRQASDRMARIRGEDPRRRAAEASGLKRGVLQDIKKINPTLRAADTAPPAPVGDMVPPPRKSGFTRGFALAILAILALVMVYSNAPQIAELLPQADPYLSTYVTWVDQMRLWLDTQVTELKKPQF
ncbi:zinc-ribbon domain-containing protein [Pseudophaeobacter leonis]|uniref:zinc-ribbon domain-containing protein n=1 Tax=Pseudophaeobacter leonis TaxID=1144477 RepID=UPI0009F21334|nr:zinc-ribbon domain-containing protein [Pseudophaeobacter leonis]